MVDESEPVVLPLAEETAPAPVGADAGAYIDIDVALSDADAAVDAALEPPEEEVAYTEARSVGHRVMPRV